MRLNEPKCDKCLKNKVKQKNVNLSDETGKENDEVTSAKIKDLSEQHQSSDLDEAVDESNETRARENVDDTHQHYDFEDIESGIAIAKCLDCDLNLCSNCLLEHQIINLDLNHKLINLIATGGGGLGKSQMQNQHISNEINNNNLKAIDKNMELLAFINSFSDKNNNIMNKSNGKHIY